jgi:oligosaccharide translocation protein RFT1
MARLSPKLQESLLEKGVTGVKYLIGLQFVTRSLTFFLNVLVTRKLDPSIIGIANVQLQFLLNTILFLSREGFRRSCLRVHNEKLRDLSALSKVTNVSWLAVPFGLLISFITCTIFLFFSSREELSTYYYVTTVKLTGVATLLEILSEPFFIMIQNELLYGVRVAVEASAVFLRCFFTFVFVFYFELGLLSFALAQICYSMALLVGYFSYFGHRVVTKRKGHSLMSVRQLFPQFGSSLREYMPSIYFSIQVEVFFVL